MSGSIRFCGVAVLLFALPGWLYAQRRSFTERPVPGMQQADVHNPFSPGYVDMTPGGYTRRYSSGGFSHSNRTFFFGNWGHGHFGVAPWDYSYYGAPPYRRDFWIESAPPPLAPPVAPLWNFAPPLNLPNGAGQGGAGQGGEPGPIEPLGGIQGPRQPRAANPEVLARATRLLTSGDDHFAAQRYRDANAQYRTATETAPSLVEAFFRQGQALLAMNQFDLAGKAFKRGLRADDRWPQASFDLTKLYGENQVARLSHLEAVAAAAEAAPLDGTLLLLVALQLYFDDQPDRALPFFRKAADLLPGDELNLSAVLKAEQ